MDIPPDSATQTYQQLRNQIHSGDILLCSGNSFFSNLIKTATQSIWSHVAFILRLDIIDRIMVLESVESIGVRTVPLSSYVDNYNGTGKGYPGKFLIARHQDVKAENISQLSKLAVDLLGYPYDNQEIARIATRIGLNAAKLSIPGMDTINGKEFICSEYAYMCFKSIGVNIDFNPLGFISPADFARSDKVKAISYVEEQQSLEKLES